MTIGGNVRRGRTARGWTQRQLAIRLGCGDMRVSSWERGEHRPSAHYEQRLAELLFDGRLSALYTESDHMDAAA